MKRFRVHWPTTTKYFLAALQKLLDPLYAMFARASEGSGGRHADFAAADDQRRKAFSHGMPGYGVALQTNQSWRQKAALTLALPNEFEVG